MAFAALDDHAVAAEPSDLAPLQHNAAAAPDDDAVAAPKFPGQPAEDDVLGVGDRHGGARGHGHFDDGRVGVGRRVEVQHARGPVQEPLARRVEFAERVHGVEPLPLAVAIAVMGRPQRDQALRRVDGLDLLVGVGPVPEPVAVEPEVAFGGPARRPVPL
jgi:hypothetical protein